MFQSAAILYTVVILGIFIVGCNARHGIDHHKQEPKDKSILCFECNSEYDPRCADPFNSYTIGVVNCSKKRPLNHITEKPTLCRKTVQKVQGHVRVIRGCGYIPDERDDKECILRAGTHDVQVRYCACKGNLCNTGNFRSYPSGLVLGSILLAITRVVQRA